MEDAGQATVSSYSLFPVADANFCGKVEVHRVVLGAASPFLHQVMETEGGSGEGEILRRKSPSRLQWAASRQWVED